MTMTVAEPAAPLAKTPSPLGARHRIALTTAAMTTVVCGIALAASFGWSWSGFFMVLGGGIVAGVTAAWAYEVHAGRLLRERNALVEELAQSQQAFNQAAKMAAIGEFAAMVVHDIKNPMATIQMVAGELESGDFSEEQRAKRAEQLQRSSRRILDLADRMGRAARQRLKCAEHADVRPFVEEGLDYLKPRCEELGVVVHWTAPGPVPAWIDGSALATAIANLVANACDAMAEQATRELHVNIKVEGLFSRIELRDSGPGVPEEHCALIFKPFYTTKPAGRGTGLGLASVRQAVTQMLGQIDCENHPDGGALFTLQFMQASPNRLRS